MTRLELYSILMITAIAMTSCDNETVIKDTKDRPYNNIDNNIANLIGDFRADINTNSRTGNDFQILSVNTKYYKITEDTVIETIPTRVDNSVFDISTVNIKVDDKDGFVVLSTDDRLNRIFYYTENGNISDTAYISPLKDYIDLIPFFASDEISNPDISAATRAASDSEIVIYPIVPYKWGQGDPFNKYTPICLCTKCGGHMPIGCVTTASAQTIATIGSFKGTYYGCKDIDFKKLPRYSYQMDSEQKSQVSHFFHEVALCCQVKFECGGSGSYVKSAYQYFKDLGYTCTYKEGSIDRQQLILELQKGYPHMIGGHSGDSGHMWIVDGIKSSASGTYYSCNWGWNGSCDGWVNGNPYTVTEYDNTTTSYSKNLRHIYIQSKPN